MRKNYQTNRHWFTGGAEAFYKFNFKVSVFQFRLDICFSDIRRDAFKNNLYSPLFSQLESMKFGFSLY